MDAAARSWWHVRVLLFQMHSSKRPMWLDCAAISQLVIGSDERAVTCAYNMFGRESRPDSTGARPSFEAQHDGEKWPCAISAHGVKKLESLFLSRWCAAASSCLARRAADGILDFRLSRTDQQMLRHMEEHQKCMPSSYESNRRQPVRAVDPTGRVQIRRFSPLENLNHRSTW